LAFAPPEHGGSGFAQWGGCWTASASPNEPVSLGARAVDWVESDIEDWINVQIEDSRISRTKELAQNAV